MNTERAFALILAGILFVAYAGRLNAATIDIPNASFESPYVDMVSPFATSAVFDWQKAPAPAWWLGAGYSPQQWTDSVGTFVNVPFAPIDNIDGRQGVFMFATPGVELFQDLSTKFEAGQSYHLAVGIEGGGYGMRLGVPLEIRLYYRDGDGNRVTVGAAAATNTNASGNLTHLTDYALDIPAVTVGDAWAGQSIGVQLVSTVSLADRGGYWDIDNVRLSSVPEPASLTLLALGALGLNRRRWRP